jgi:pyridoxal phosphate enzyme (YggS family)
MIGHLQSRKAGIVAAHFHMLQSLDSLHLAQKVDRLVEQANPSKILPVLLEVNVSGEDSKSGFSGWSEAQWELLIPDFEQILALPHLSVKGLMTMPPLVERPEENRPFFTRLSKLRDELNRRLNGNCFTQLSMGTSHDFEIAVEEGATFVRVGTAIVGPRPPKKTQ